MGNVYEEGKADERQSEGVVMADEHKLFRKRYRQLSAEEIALHDAIKDKADELAALIASVKPKGRVVPTPLMRDDVDHTVQSRLVALAENDFANVTLALRHLEDCVYRAVKALTA
jgi:hypothetical protein